MKFMKFFTFPTNLLFFFTLIQGMRSSAQLVGGSGPVWSSVSTPCSGTQLTGTVIGTAGSYGNSGNTKHKVFDNNNSTYFDALAADGQWAGLDLGTSMNITCIRFCPRSYFYSRMPGGKFQISTDSSFTNPVTIYTIPATLVSQFQDYYISSGNSTVPTQARYIRYLSPDSGWGNIAEMTVYGVVPPLPPPSPATITYQGNVDMNGYKLVGSAGSSKGLTVDSYGRVIVDSAIFGHTIFGHSFKTHYDYEMPDYVFEDDYSLKALSEVEDYIKQYKHLPDVPSDTEYKERGTIDLKEMNLLLLRKVEELTLHLIDLDKRIRQLQNKARY